jgi:toxin ParE1/3/4
MRLIWTAPALRDLAYVRTYVATDSPSAAAKQVQAVISATETLSRFPEIGRPGRRSGTRELVVSGTPFIVPYRIRGDIIQILRVLHGRQRWPERLP